MLSTINTILFACTVLVFSINLGHAKTTTAKFDTLLLNRSWTNSSLSITSPTTQLPTTLVHILNKTGNVSQNKIQSTMAPNKTTFWPPALINLHDNSNSSHINHIYEEFNSTNWPSVIEDEVETDEWNLETVVNGTAFTWNDSSTRFIETTSPTMLESNVTVQSEGLKTEMKIMDFEFNVTRSTTQKAFGQGISDVGEMLKSTTNKYFEKVSNFASLSLDQLQSLPNSIWATAKDEVLKTLNSNQTVTILEKIKAGGDMQTWKKLVEILRDKLDTKYILGIIQNQTNNDHTLDKSLINTLIGRLGSSESWNETIIDSLGPASLNFPPPILMKITNKAAMAKISDYLVTYLVSSETQRQPIFQSYSGLAFQCAEIVYGPLKKWQYINSSLAPLLTIIHPLTMKQIQPSSIVNSTEVLGKVKFCDRTHAQPLIEMILKNVNFSALTKETTLQLVRSLGDFVRHLKVQDVFSIPRNTLDDNVIHQLCNNTDIDKELGKWLLSVSKPRENEWTKNDVHRLQPLLGFASSQLLAELASKNLLDATAIKAILQNQHLDKSHLRSMESLLIKEFKNGDEWDLQSAPAMLLTIISSSDLKKMTNSNIVKQMDKFNKMAKYMSPAQKIAIALKIEELELAELANMEVIPHNYYLSLMTFDNTANEEQLKKILRNMPIDSPQVVNYINLKWSRISQNVTIDEFRNDLIMLKSLTCEMLELIKDEHIMDLLKIISDTDLQLPLKTTMCVADKLKKHLSASTKKSVTQILSDDETRLLSAISIGDLGTIGGQHLIHFHPMSLQEQSPKQKCEFIFSLIGQVPLRTLNLIQPPEKKRQLARAALSCIEKSESPLKSVDAYIIGNFIGYTTETVLANMETNALTVSLPYINGRSSAFEDGTCGVADQGSELKPPPCMTTTARNTLRHKLSNTFGSPENWGETELRSIGCLLSALYPEQLNQISDKAILSVADELIKCWDHENTSPSNVYTTLCQKELPLTATAMMAESSRQLKRRLAKAAIQETEVRPRMKRNAEQKKTYLTCDVVAKLGPAVVEMTEQELDSISPSNVIDCLEDLGRHPMSHNKAILLWNKLKQALGKSAANLDGIYYESMGYIAQGLNSTEIMSLSLKTPTQIAVFGANYRNFSQSQLKVLANQVLLNYPTNASQWSSDELIHFGYILCGFPTMDIDQILPDVYTKISHLLKEVIATCPLETKQAFARKALSHYGPSVNWTSAIITSIGPVLGGLLPTQITQLPGHSFQGLTSTWVKTLPISLIRVLHREQLGNLSVETASNFSPEQLNQLSASDMEVINQLKGIPSSTISGLQVKSITMFLLFLLPVLMI